MSDERAQDPAATPAAADRPLAPAVPAVASLVGAAGLLAGLALAVAALFGHGFGAWRSASPLTPGLIGAAMAGVAPGLFMVGAADSWEEVRTLMAPTLLLLAGQPAINLTDRRDLYAAHGGTVILVGFSLAWIGALAGLAVAAVFCVGIQYRVPRGGAGGAGVRLVPLPAWTKAPLALLGSALAGIGGGLLAAPGFGRRSVPWPVTDADARSLGLWALVLGLGVLATLAEDDLARSQPAVLAVLAAGAGLAVLVGVRHRDVRWSGGPGFGAAVLVVLVAGLVISGVVATVLIRRAAAVSDPGRSAEPACRSPA